MTPEMIELSKRAVACKGWRWMPGMLGWRPDNNGVPHSIRFMEGVESMEALAGAGAGPLVASAYATYDGYWRSDEVTPDLTDPATLGCLLALVREAWNADWIHVVCDQMNDPEDGGYLWRVCVPWASDIVAPSEAEALVVALEAK